MSVWDGPVMKHLHFHIRGERREIKRSPIAAVLEVMMQRKRERAASHHRKLFRTFYTIHLSTT